MWFTTIHRSHQERLNGNKMMDLKAQNPILICIDIQLGILEEEYWGGNRNNKNAEETCAKIIHKWREINGDVIHVQHSSTNKESKLHPSHTGFAFNPLCAPIEGEMVITKSVNSCFIGTNLKQILDDKNCDCVVMIGLNTDHCVSTSARMAANLGYETILISDAMATFDRVGVNGEVYDSDLVHNITLASLKDEFVTVLSSKELLELL